MTARRTIAITGASAGIGAALARVCAAKGYDLILIARREAPLSALAAEVEEAHGIKAHVITADLAEPDASQKLVAAVAAKGLTVDGLINNAGFSNTKGFVTTPPEAQAAMLRVMLTVPVELSRVWMPGMQERGWGRILNVASMAGFLQATGGDTLYGPIKSFLIRFSQGLWIENRGKGVHVTALCPGYTYTEFHDVNGSRDQVSKAYPKWMWLSAERVAQDGWDAVEADRPRIIPGKRYRVLATISKLMPDRMGLNTAAKHAKALERI
ncbi:MULTISPECIES: SDR family NAD(P)-dependent oxidoreductase [unclassified Brevundimonas]|uniref:SDR family NAD(P)-dependent oxidoreductase n=1 Tax=unclassified Brevundimonas TaxID=2622653 RepID=UPI0025C5A4B4|nr:MULTISPECIES: SDR family oxidoreductase [unclassified Brevundimonas]